MEFYVLHSTVQSLLQVAKYLSCSLSVIRRPAISLVCVAVCVLLCVCECACGFPFEIIENAKGRMRGDPWRIWLAFAAVGRS